MRYGCIHPTRTTPPSPFSPLRRCRGLGSGGVVADGGSSAQNARKPAHISSRFATYAVKDDPSHLIPRRRGGAERAVRGRLLRTAHLHRRICRRMTPMRRRGGRSTGPPARHWWGCAVRGRRRRAAPSSCGRSRWRRRRRRHRRPRLRDPRDPSLLGRIVPIMRRSLFVRAYREPAVERVPGASTGRTDRDG